MLGGEARRSERNKGPSVPRRLRARGSDHRRFAAHRNLKKRNETRHPVLGVA
jgi:hypothetical protein